MCECCPTPIKTSPVPVTIFLSSPPPRVRSTVAVETRRFFTYAGKYCKNPRRHVFGGCKLCRGLKVKKGLVDPKDLVARVKMGT